MKNSHDFTENLKVLKSLFFIKVKTYCLLSAYCFCFVLLLFFLRFLSAVNKYFREKGEIRAFRVTKLIKLFKANGNDIRQLNKIGNSI